MNKKIIVFGGTGFIGHNLLKKLQKKKFKITSVSKKKPKKKDRIYKVKYLSCDVTNYKILKKIKSNYNFVINLSGNIDHKNFSQTMKTHYQGCKNLVNFFFDKKIKLFIQIGSSLEYGNLKSPHLENYSGRVKSVYGLAKLKATNYLKKINKKKNFPFVVLRPYQIYGPYQKTVRLIPYVIKSCLKNNQFSCTDGNQFRDFMHVDDFTNLIIKIIQKKIIINGVFNVGLGKPHKVKNIINLIQQIIKKGKPLFGKIKMRKDENKIYFPNIQKIKNNFKWKANVGIIKGLKKTIKYYEKL